VFCQACEDLSRVDRDFIAASLDRETLECQQREQERAQRERLRRVLLWGAVLTGNQIRT
jgi:hypothetical protein